MEAPTFNDNVPLDLALTALRRIHQMRLLAPGSQVEGHSSRMRATYIAGEALTNIVKAIKARS